MRYRLGESSTRSRLEVQAQVNKHRYHLQQMVIIEGIKSGSFDLSWLNVVGVYRGEQPESPIHSALGAMRGDAPLSLSERKKA